MGMRNGHRLVNSTVAHVEAVKRPPSLAPSNVHVNRTWLGTCTYQKPRLKSMAHGVYARIAQYISVMRDANSTCIAPLYTLHTFWKKP